MRPLIIAHRGASAEFKENTIQAYDRAIQLGVDFIEVDLHLTKDGIPVCHHDPNLNLPNQELRIVDQTRQKIQETVEGHYMVPSLLEVLRLERQHIGLMLELKEGDNPVDELAQAAATLVETHKSFYEGHIILGSLSPVVHRALVPLLPRECRIGIVEDEESYIAHLAENPLYLGLDDQLADGKRVKQLVDHGHRVWVWTVDDGDRARDLVKLGVSGIITNDPAKVIRAFA